MCYITRLSFLQSTDKVDNPTVVTENLIDEVFASKVSARFQRATLRITPKSECRI